VFPIIQIFDNDDSVLENSDVIISFSN